MYYYYYYLKYLRTIFSLRDILFDAKSLAIFRKRLSVVSYFEMTSIRRKKEQEDQGVMKLKSKVSLMSYERRFKFPCSHVSVLPY